MAGDGSRSRDDHGLDAIFHPQSIAVVGASANPRSQGHNYVRHLLDYGFQGNIYPVNPGISEALGLPVYPSVAAIPGPVDYVISCIPMQAVLDLVDQCAAKGVKAIHFFTARFSETGRSEAAELERELGRRARAAGIRIIGPNCMGLYNPSAGISFKYNLPREAGTVGFFSQSGGNAEELAYNASLRGVRFSKVISYGNALDLNEADFLEYFAHDPDTRVITGYIEGVKDGRRFMQTLRDAAAVKPVIILKGGRTSAGTKAVASHTASLAGSYQVWQAAVSQAGGLVAGSLDETIDLLVAFLFLPPAHGRSVGIAGGGGGRSVLSADEAEEAGLVVTPLPGEIREVLRERAPGVWDWVGNPVDGSILGAGSISVQELLAMMAESDHYDALIANVGEDWILDRPEGREGLERTVEGFIQVARKTAKPLTVVLGPADTPEEWRWQAVMEARQHLIEAGLPVFPTVGRAARALRRFMAYHEQRQDKGNGREA